MHAYSVASRILRAQTGREQETHPTGGRTGARGRPEFKGVRVVIERGSHIPGRYSRRLAAAVNH